jgi:hypothetical protein
MVSRAVPTVYQFSDFRGDLVVPVSVSSSGPVQSLALDFKRYRVCLASRAVAIV